MVVTKSRVGGISTGQFLAVRLLSMVFMLLTIMCASAQAATVTVTNTSDTGSGSLRDAITFANANPGTTISFNIPIAQASSGMFTIQPASALPTITASGTIIDGSTQTTATGNTNSSGPEIELNGTLTDDETSGFIVQAANCVIKNLNKGGFKTY